MQVLDYRSRYLLSAGQLEKLRAQGHVKVFDCATHLVPDPDKGYAVKSGRSDYEKCGDYKYEENFRIRNFMAILEILWNEKNGNNEKPKLYFKRFLQTSSEINLGDNREF